MNKNELYMHLDAIKLALDSAAVLLGSQGVYELDGKQLTSISQDNVASINATIYVAERMLRDILNDELSQVGDDSEEDD